MVEAFFGGFGEHWFGWRFEREENTDGGVFTVDDVAKVAYLGDADIVAALDRDNDLFCFARIVGEYYQAVDTFVRSFLALFLSSLGTKSLCTDKRKNPPFKSVFVFLGEFSCPVDVLGLADDTICCRSQRVSKGDTFSVRVSPLLTRGLSALEHQRSNA